MIIFLSWCSCNIVSPVLPRLSSYGTQACDLYTWDGPNSGIPSVKRSVWSGCIFQNWFYFNQCVYIRNPQTLLSHYPQTIPNHDHFHHSENRKRSSHVCNPPYNHGPHSYLLHLNYYCKASDYVVMITYTGRTLSLSFCFWFMTPFLSCFFLIFFVGFGEIWSTWSLHFQTPNCYSMIQWGHSESTLIPALYFSSNECRHLTCRCNARELNYLNLGRETTSHSQQTSKCGKDMFETIQPSLFTLILGWEGRWTLRIRNCETSCAANGRTRSCRNANIAR